MKIPILSQGTTSITSISLEWLSVWNTIPAVSNGRREAISSVGGVRHIWKQNAIEVEQVFSPDVNPIELGTLAAVPLSMHGGKHVKHSNRSERHSRSSHSCSSQTKRTNRRWTLMLPIWMLNGPIVLMKSWNTVFETLHYLWIFSMQFKRFDAKKRLLLLRKYRLKLHQMEVQANSWTVLLSV